MAKYCNRRDCLDEKGECDTAKLRFCRQATYRKKGTQVNNYKQTNGKEAFNKNNS